MTRLLPATGYESLAAILDDALAHAQTGKGSIRHASGEPFVEQPIVFLNEHLGSNHGAIFQAQKKSRESTRLPYAMARAELLGAINYLAAAVLVLDRAQVVVEPVEPEDDEWVDRGGMGGEG